MRGGVTIFFINSNYIVIQKPFPYSERRLLTGFNLAAFNAWKLTVSRVINIADTIVARKSHQEICVRYGYFSSQLSISK